MIPKTTTSKPYGAIIFATGLLIFGILANGYVNNPVSAQQ
jgi:hypothetical protein